MHRAELKATCEAQDAAAIQAALAKATAAGMDAGLVELKTAAATLARIQETEKVLCLPSTTVRPQLFVAVRPQLLFAVCPQLLFACLNY